MNECTLLCPLALDVSQMGSVWAFIEIWAHMDLLEIQVCMYVGICVGLCLYACVYVCMHSNKYVHVCICT